ncbi:hypothetical protein NCC49_004143 [Naganishia albida]|nr:hypothetical protein NCC49_004143 [Naganishia albida]
MSSTQTTTRAPTAAVAKPVDKAIVPGDKPLKRYTREEVGKHNKEGDVWVIVDSIVYDLSKFAEIHPGGISVLLDADVAGKECTAVFFGLHRQEILYNPRYAKLVIGQIENEQQLVRRNEAGAISQVPYAEPMWLSPGYKRSPYFKESHYALQKEVRKFVDEHVYPDAQACEESGKRASQAILDMMAESNLHAMRMGPGKHLAGRSLFGGIVKPEEFDYFHEMVINQELARVQARGYGDGFQAGTVIGLPPVLNYANPTLKKEIVDACFSGKKNISLAISEAFVGSDVAGMRTRAVKSEDGKYYTINGAKKWITGGMHAHYFTVGTKTDKGLTVFLVPRQEGVETRPIKTAYSAAAGTAYVTFKDVKVPVENMLGKENEGIKVILANFNHERWVMICSSARSSRAAVEECMKWACQRRVFGAPLIAQPVIRQKLAEMMAKCEAVQAWLEAVTFQMCNMTYGEMSENLAGQIAFLKAFATRCAGEISSDAVQIFGGRGLTRSGMGKHIEMFRRTQKFDAILGGAEEVLFDLGVRQAMKKMPKNARL